MSGDHNPLKFQCVCCVPPRQIYLRQERGFEQAFHEVDNTPAIQPKMRQKQ